MNRIVRAAVLCLCFLCASFAQNNKEQNKQLRVCADPQNLPFSNDKLEGFENRIAELLAKEFGASLTYIWWGQRQGFIRNTMNATLKEARCEIVIGVPAGYDLVETTRPYYRSTYVFVYPKGSPTPIKSLDEPILKKMKIGVHLLGDDYTNPPPVHELARRGIVNNVVGFDTFYSAANPPDRLVNAVAAGKVDVAVVWGPAAGYFVRRQAVPLEMVAIPSGKADLPFAFDISMGVRRGETALKDRLAKMLDRKRVEILRILKDYDVPVLDLGPGRISK